MFQDRPLRVNRRKKKRILLPILLSLIMIALASLLVAWVWQRASGDDEKLLSHSSGASQSAAEAASGAAKTSSEPEASSSSEASSSEPEPPAYSFKGAVPESERVRSDYFDDAVFVGDSITTGIPLYGVMNTTTVLAGTGINLASVYSAEVVKQEDGTLIPIVAGLEKAQYEKVYVMLGGNEVRDEDKAAFIDRYSKFIDKLKELQPDALLYIQSILPVTKNNQYRMNNPRIDEFNAALMTLCAEKKVYYLNVAECMKDENGMLPDAASPADGMHFGPEYYNKWFEYLKTHTVEQP